jgi:hypothetical protein
LARAAKDVRGCFFFSALYARAYFLLYALGPRLTLAFLEGAALFPEWECPEEDAEREFPHS